MKNRTYFSKLVSILLVSCMLLSMLPVTGAAAAGTETVVFSRDFEDGQVGASSTKTDGGAVEVVADPENSENHVLHIQDTQTDSNTSNANFRFLDKAASGEISVSFRLYLSSTTDVVGLTIGSYANTNKYATASAGEFVRFKTISGQFAVRGSTAGTYVKDSDRFQAETWYDLKVTANTDTGAVAAYYGNDTTPFATSELAKKSDGSWQDNIDNIAFLTESAGLADVYVDDVVVSVKAVDEEDPSEEPSEEPVEDDDAVFFQNFEGEVTYASTPTGETKVTTMADGNKVLELVDNDTGSTIARAHFDFEPQSGEITMSFKMQVVADVEGADVDTVLDFACGSKENAGGACTAKARQILLAKTVPANKQLQFQGRGESKSAKTSNNIYDFGEWVEVKLVLDTDAGEFEFFVDGASQGTAKLCYDTEGHDLDKIDNLAFFTESTAKAHAYIDDVKVTVKATGGETPSPTPTPTPSTEPDDPTPGGTEYWVPAQSDGGTFTTTANEVIATLPKSGVTMAVGEGTWTVSNNNNGKPLNINGVAYTKYMRADASPKVAQSKGEYFNFAIPADIPAGELIVCLRVNGGDANKQLVVQEDGEDLSGYEEYQPPAANVDAAVKIAAVGGKTYTVYVTSSMPYFYGFSFRPVDLEADVAAFQAEIDKLDFNWIRGQNTSASAVDKDLYLTTSYTSGFGACDVNWTCSNVAVDNTGKINPLKVDTEVTLTANISVQQISYLNLNKEFKVTVKALTDDTQAVANAKAALSLGAISAVKKDLVLPAEGRHGTNITWASSDPAVMTVDTTKGLGIIHPNDSSAQTVILTATIKRGSVTDTKEFEVTVAASKILDVNSWAYATASGEARFAPVDGGKLHSINVTNNNQHLDTDDYKFKVEILNASGAVKATSREWTASSFFAAHGAGVSEHIDLGMPMDSGDTFRVTAYDDTKTYVTFTHGAADDVLAPGAKIYVIGDSTAAVYDDSKYPQTGWAQVLEGFFDGVEVVDLAIPGRSSLDFKTRQQFQDLKTNIQPGDYLIIQFGHNDSHNGDPTIYTDPSLDRFTDGDAPSYKKCMAEYVTLAWDAGAYPIIATSISRRKLADTTGELYANAAKALAEELSIPCVDVLAASNGWVNKVGLVEAIDMFNIIKPQDSRFYNDPQYKNSGFWNGNNEVESQWDNTHVNINGAKLIAMYAADGIKALSIPVGAKRNNAKVSETLPHYADAISGPPPASEDKTPAQTGCIDFEGDGWKLQLPVEDPNKVGYVLEKSPAELAAGYADDYFYADVDEAGDDAVVFHVPVEGFKTANTSYTRSELREMLDPSDKTVNWTWEGTHTLTAEQRVTHVPASGKVITSQIHGIEQNGDNANPLVKVVYAYDAAARTGKVIVQIKKTTVAGSGDTNYEFSNVPLGQKYKTVIRVEDGTVAVTVSTVENGTERVQTYTEDFVAADANWKETWYYFKLGAYIQDNTDTSTDAYADVWAYSAAVTHRPAGVEELPPLPAEVTVTAGAESVSNKYAVSGTGNKVLRFTVTPSVTTSRLNGGVKFYVESRDGSQAEVLRFKLDSGKFKIAEVTSGTASAYTTLGSYEAEQTYTVKLVMTPKSGQEKAQVKIYLVDGATETILGTYTPATADLAEFSVLDFFADSSSSGTLAYTGISYETGVTLDPGTEKPPVTEGTVLSQDFAGAVDYVGSHAGAEVTTVDGNQVLAITDTETASSSTPARANFAFEPLSGEITITFKLNVLTEDSVIAFLCGSKTNTGSQCTSSAGEFLRIKTLGTSKRFQYRGGTGTGVTATNYTYSCGQWIDAKVVIDTEAGTFTAYADGTLLGSAKLSNTNSAVALNNIDNIAFMSEKAGVAQVYVDDVVVSVKKADTGEEPPEQPIEALPESVTVTAAASAVTNRYAVSGTGNQALTFTVIPSAATGLSGGVKFLTDGANGTKVEVLRLKLDNGTFKLAEVRSGTATYASLGSYTAGTAYDLKVVIVPKAGDQKAFVKVYQVADGSQTQLGDGYAISAADLGQITQLDFFADAERAGTLAYTAIAFQTDVALSEEESTPPAAGPEEDPDKLPANLTYVAGDPVRQCPVITGAGNTAMSFTVTPSATGGLKGGIKFYNSDDELLRFKLDGGVFKIGEVIDGAVVYTSLDAYEAEKEYDIKLVFVPADGDEPGRAYICLGGQQVGSLALTRTDPLTIDNVSFFTDGGSMGGFVYNDISYASGVDFDPQDTPVMEQELLKIPSAWTLGENASIQPGKLTITAGTASSSNRVDVSGAGVKTLSFDVAVDVDDLKDLKGGVNFRDADGNTVLRFKMQGGGFRLSDLQVDLNGKTVYQNIKGSYAKKDAFRIKIELYPATAKSNAYVKVYKDGAVICDGYVLEGENAATLESITRLYVFTDSNSGGSYTYSNMIYRTGPKAPAQAGGIDLTAGSWKLLLPVEDSAQAGAALEKSPTQLADGYTDAYFYATTDADGDDAVVFHTPADGFKAAGDSYVRTELREAADEAGWSWDGVHTLTTEQLVAQVSAGGQVVTAQVHSIGKNGEDAGPLAQVRYVYDGTGQTGKVVVELTKTTASDPDVLKYEFPHVALGQKYQTDITVRNGAAVVTVRTTDADGNARTETYRHDFAEADSAWKTLQYAFGLGGSASEGTSADVWVYSGQVKHEAAKPTVSPVDRPSTSQSSYSDGSSSVVETWKDGATVITQTAANGDTMRTEKAADGATRITVEAQNGTADITVDADGTTAAKVAVSAMAVSRAQRTGEVLTLPMPQLTAGKDLDSAPTVAITRPTGETLRVKMPVKQPTGGTVPVAVLADGTQEIIKMSVPTQDGVLFDLGENMTVKLVNNAHRFDDVNAAHWASEAVDFVSGRELLTGTGATTFQPESATTRAMMVTVLARLDGVDTAGGETWYSKGMEWAMAQGVSDGTNPEGLISREQFVTMLYRYAGQPATGRSVDLGAFVDGGTVSDWAAPAMEWATSTGVMRGRMDGTLDPVGPTTRAEAATLLMRYCAWNLGLDLEVTTPAASQETVALDMDFDAEALGRSWVPGTKVVDLDGQRVVEITDTDPTQNVMLNYTFAPQSGKVTISYKLYIDPEQADSAIVMACGSRSLTGKYSFNSNGEFMRLKTTGASRKFQTRGGDSIKTPSVSAGSYRPGEWIDILVILDTDNQTFSAYANGELLGNNQPMSRKSGVTMSAVDNITFMTEKAGLARGYIDEVKVTGKAREFSIWDESVDSCLAMAGAGSAGLLSDVSKWQLKQGEIVDNTLVVTGGEDSASNRVSVSGAGNQSLSFTVEADNDSTMKGGVRFVSGGTEVLRFKLEGGKFKVTDMRTGDTGKAVYQTLGSYSAETPYEMRILFLRKTAGQAAGVKVYVDGQQLGATYAVSDEAAAALEKTTQLNFFTDKGTAGTFVYSDIAYQTDVAAPEETSVQSPVAVPPSGDTPAGTGAIDFRKDGWKLQIPVENPAKAGSVLEKSPEELAGGYTDEFFYADKDEDGTPAVVFHSPVKGFKTGNTSYARSELRELIDGSDSKVNWGWQGTHILVTEERVTHVPASGATITSQIHGIEKNGDNANPLVKVRYMYEAAKGTGKVRVELKNTTSPTSYDYKYDFPNVALGQKYRTEILVFDGVACVTISTTDPDGTQRSETYRHDFVAADPYWKETLYYFKLGNYIQDNKDESDEAYADVWVYSSSITHSDTVDQVPVSELTMDQPNVSIRSGERTGLSVTAQPIKAYDKSVVWAVTEGSDVAAVDKNGYVTGLREGVATVTATSVSNPAASTSCVVTVKDVAVVEVRPIFANDFGTDGSRTDPASYSGENCEITRDAPAGAEVSVVQEDGNNIVTLRDETSAAPAKLSFVFPPQTDTTTITFRVRIDALGEHQEGKADFGRLYIVAAGSDDWYSDSNELFRIRNNAKGSLGNFSGLNYVLTDRYNEITMNADQVTGGYGDWVDVAFVVTPNNGTAKANTTDVYMNGYPVALAVANRNNVDYVNRLDVQSGTADQLTFSVDDVRAYTGIVVPENAALVRPDSIKLTRVPAVMAVTDSAQATAEVSPAGSYDAVNYSVVSGDAICVSEDGYVTAVKAGTAELQAESALDSAIFARQTVTVQPTVVRPESLNVPSIIHVGPGQTERLQVTVLPANATEKGVKFEITSGGEVAAVDSQGNVTGKSVGTAVVRVTSLSDPAVYETVSVSVTRTLAPGELIFAEDFSSAQLDSASWTTTLAKDNTFVEMKDGAMTLIDANGAANPKINLDFTPASGKVSIQFRVKVGGEVTIQGGSTKSTGYRNQRIAFGSGNIATTANESFCLRGNGTHFTYNTTGSTYVELPGDYDVANWNEVTMVATINVDGPDTTDVYINGVKVLAGAPNKVDYPAIDALCFSADTASFAIFTIDDLAIWAGDYGDKPTSIVNTTARFSDVPITHWASEAIGFACDRGLLNGTGDGAFAPEAITTRAAVVTILARLDGVDTAGGDTWYSKGTEWAVTKGISDGANPDGAISREQFVTMLYRYAGQPQVVGQVLSTFADSAAVSAWAAPAMEWAVETGLMQGRTDGTLDPSGTTTRAEAAALLMRYCQNAQ